MRRVPVRADVYRVDVLLHNTPFVQFNSQSILPTFRDVPHQSDADEIRAEMGSGFVDPGFPVLPLFNRYQCCQRRTAERVDCVADWFRVHGRWFY